MIARWLTAFLLFVALPILPQSSANCVLKERRQTCSCGMKMSCCQSPQPSSSRLPLAPSRVASEIKLAAAARVIGALPPPVFAVEPLPAFSRVCSHLHTPPPLTLSGILLI